jgi:ribosomal protein S18 acetylase RimI-like enzyme
VLGAGVLGRTSGLMPLQLELATAEDVPALAALHAAVAASLTATFGDGHWSRPATERGVLFSMRHAKVYVARQQGRPIATLTLATKKPWAIDRGYFTAVTRPLYLLAMAVDPALQRRGIGRECVAQARTLAARWPADAIFLDAYDAEAGAGEFYRKCGFREVGRVTYKKTPLIYFEMLM